MPSSFPTVKDADKVGSYPPNVGAGGGYVWDDVLEYRVWCHPERGAPDLIEGNDYFYTFTTCEEAQKFAEENAGTEAPLALVMQDEYIEEPQPGEYVHRTGPRMTEWPIEFLRRPRRTPQTIPSFLAKDAPANRLDILRGDVT